MDSHCINIAVSGLSLKVSDELKILIRDLISNQYGINWVNISSNQIDLLIINENFLMLTIFKIFLIRKISLFKNYKNTFRKWRHYTRTYLTLPFRKTEHLRSWLQANVLSLLKHTDVRSNSTLLNEISIIDEQFIKICIALKILNYIYLMTRVPWQLLIIELKLLG